MGQQQLLLIVLGTIIVGAAVLVGINMFTKGSVNAEQDALLNDINNVAYLAVPYWHKPASMGGGSRSFLGTTDVTDFGADITNLNGTLVMSEVGANQFTLTATGATEGVIIVVTITQQGVSGNPTITLP